MKRGIHLIQALAFVAAILFGALVIGPLRTEAMRRADLIKTRLINQLESDLNISIRFGSISPALLSAVTVRDVEVNFPQGTFLASRLRVFYNPLKRFREGERNPADWISRVSVSRGHLFAEIDPGGNQGSYDFRRLIEGKTIVLDDFSSEIGGAGIGSVRADGVSLVLSDRREITRYRFEGSVLSDNLAALPSASLVGGSLKSDGSFSQRDSTFNGRFDIVSARVDELILKPMSVDLTLADGGLTLRRIDDETPIDIALRAMDGNLSVAGEMINLPVDQIVQIGPSGSPWAPWLATALTGTFSLDFDTAESNLSYKVDLNADIRDEAPLPWPVSAEIAASGSRDSAFIRSLKMSVPGGVLRYSGRLDTRDLAPDGILSLSISEDAVGYPIDSSFKLFSVGSAVSAEPIHFAAGDLQFFDFRFLLVREKNSVVLSLLAVPGRPDETRRKRLLVDAMLNTEGSPVLHGFASIEGFDGVDVAQLVGLETFRSARFVRDSTFGLKGLFEASADSWVFSLEDATLISRSNPENRISLRGRATPERISVDGLRVNWNDHLADGRGYVYRNADGGYGRGRIIVDEVLYPIDAAWSSEGPVNISGDFGLSAQFGRRRSAGRRFSILGEGIGIPVNAGRLEANFDVRGYLGTSDWEVDVRESLFTLAAGDDGPESVAQLSGTINPTMVDFPQLRLSDASGPLSGSASLLFSPNGEFVGRIEMISDGSERYELAAARTGNAWDLNLSIREGRLRRLARPDLDGRLNVQGSLSGPLDDPVLNMDLSVENGMYKARPFEINGRAGLAEGKLRIQDTRLSRDGIVVEDGLAFVDLASGSARITAQLAATYNQVPLSTGMSLAVDFETGAPLLDPRSLLGQNFSGTLATQPVMWDGRPHLPGFTFQFLRDENRFQVRTPDPEVLALRYRFADGRIDISSGDPLPFTIVGGGTVHDGRIDLSFPTLSIDPILVNYVMVRDPILLQYHVIFQEGRIIGNLDIRGPSGSPDIYGSLRAVNLKVDTPYTYADIRPASTSVLFEGNKITFERIEIPVGGGYVFGEGYIVLDSWRMTDFDMTYGCVSSPEGDGVPVYYPLLGVYLDGIAEAEIRMKGGTGGFILEGDILLPYLKASLGSPRVPVVQRKPGKRPTPVSLDFRIRTGNSCTFYLPNEQFKIVRATAEPEQELRLLYRNNPKSLSLVGNLPIKSGEIYYFDRDFQITEGAMVFNETLEDFDPTLQIRAGTRVRDDENQDVTVALVYDAPVKSDFNPRIETVPAKSDIEILALFGRAVVPYGDSGGANVNAVLLATGGMFAQMGLVQPFEEVLREGLNLDMVTIRTDIIENTIAESLNRESGPEVQDQVSGLGRFLDNTSLYAGKYIGNALFVSGSVAARYFEGQRLRSVFGGLEFETSVSLEMATPFFNVAWSYSPDPLVAQNFVADNEISLRWQFSY